jgi:hypothetical protein
MIKLVGSEDFSPQILEGLKSLLLVKLVGSENLSPQILEKLKSLLQTPELLTYT